MNIETGEIKPLSELTLDERASGKWVPVPKREERSRAFNGRHREARVAKFNGALKRKQATRKHQRKLKQAAQRRNRA